MMRGYEPWVTHSCWITQTIRTTFMHMNSPFYSKFDLFTRASYFKEKEKASLLLHQCHERNLCTRVWFDLNTSIWYVGVAFVYVSPSKFYRIHAFTFVISQSHYIHSGFFYLFMITQESSVSLCASRLIQGDQSHSPLAEVPIKSWRKLCMNWLQRGRGWFRTWILGESKPLSLKPKITILTCIVILTL